MLELSVSGELTQLANEEMSPPSSVSLVTPLQQVGGISSTVLFL